VNLGSYGDTLTAEEAAELIGVAGQPEAMEVDGGGSCTALIRSNFY